MLEVSFYKQGHFNVAIGYRFERQLNCATLTKQISQVWTG